PQPRRRRRLDPKVGPCLPLTPPLEHTSYQRVSWRLSGGPRTNLTHTRYKRRQFVERNFMEYTSSGTQSIFSPIAVRTGVQRVMPSASIHRNFSWHESGPSPRIKEAVVEANSE